MTQISNESYNLLRQCCTDINEFIQGNYVLHDQNFYQLILPRVESATI